MAEKYCKYSQQQKYYSTDGGNTYQPVVPAEYRIVALVEEYSPDCGYTPIYRWQILPVDEAHHYCIDYDLYQMEQKYVSYNNGTTWTPATPTEYRQGQLVRENDTEYCEYGVEWRTVPDEYFCVAYENSHIQVPDEIFTEHNEAVLHRWFYDNKIIKITNKALYTFDTITRQFNKLTSVKWNTTQNVDLTSDVRDKVYRMRYNKDLPYSMWFDVFDYTQKISYQTEPISYYGGSFFHSCSLNGNIYLLKVQLEKRNLWMYNVTSNTLEDFSTYTDSTFSRLKGGLIAGDNKIFNTIVISGKTSIIEFSMDKTTRYLGQLDATFRLDCCFIKDNYIYFYNISDDKKVSSLKRASLDNLSEIETLFTTSTNKAIGEYVTYINDDDIWTGWGDYKNTIGVNNYDYLYINWSNINGQYDNVEKYCLYEKLEKYVNSQPTGEFKQGNLIGCDYDVCDNGG